MYQIVCMVLAKLWYIRYPNYRRIKSNHSPPDYTHCSFHYCLRFLTTHHCLYKLSCPFKQRKIFLNMEMQAITYSLTSKLFPPFFEPRQAAFHAIPIIFISVTNCLKATNAGRSFINGSIMQNCSIVPLCSGLGRPHVDHWVPSQKHIL